VNCVTDQGLTSRHPRQHEQWRSAYFQDGFAILNRRAGNGLRLEIRHRFTVERTDGSREPWRVSTAEYVYEVADERDDLIAAWHWHPATVEQEDRAHWPHVHAYGDRETMTLHKLHLPTGRVSIEALVRFLIDDLDVTPRRTDWRAIINRHEAIFQSERTWA
jgi:hypothetical protein